MCAVVCVDAEEFTMSSSTITIDSTRTPYDPLRAALALLEWICKLPVAPARTSREDEYRAAWDRWRETPPTIGRTWSEVHKGAEGEGMRATVDPLLDRIDALAKQHSSHVERINVLSQRLANRNGTIIDVSRAAGVDSTNGDVIAAAIEKMRTDFLSLDMESTRVIAAQAIALDCEPEEIHERAEQLTAAQDRWYDFRTELCDALGCEEAPGAIVAAVLDLKHNAHHDREMRTSAESAMVALAKEVERLHRECDRLAGRKPRRGLFAMLAAVLR